MRIPTQILLLLVALVLLQGCGDRQAREQEDMARVPKTSKSAATQLEQAFADVPNPESRQLSSDLALAIRDQNYNEAIKALGALRTQRVENMNQAMAIENAMRRLQADILQAMEAGDPNAKRAWMAMKKAGKS